MPRQDVLSAMSRHQHRARAPKVAEQIAEILAGIVRLDEKIEAQAKAQAKRTVEGDRASYTIPEFCKRNAISARQFFKLPKSRSRTAHDGDRRSERCAHFAASRA